MKKKNRFQSNRIKKNNKETILIVDDQTEIRDSLSRYLVKRFNVLRAASKDEALDILRGMQVPKIVITDIRLDDSNSSNRDGLLLLEEIHTLLPNLPVIVMSAYGLSQFVFSQKKGKKVDAFALGAFDIISKPINLDELDAVIDFALQQRGLYWLRKIKKALSVWLPPILAFFFFLFVWEGAIKFFKIKEYLLPAPSRVLEVFVEDFGSLLKDTGITILEAFLGFLLANILSILIAVAFCYSRIFERSFYPYVIAFKSIPLIAIAPLLILWFKYGIWSKVIMAAIISFFPLVVNATQGLKSVDRESLELLHSLSASSSQILFKLRFPHALPYMFSALKISSTLSVVGAIVGELTGPRMGIGFVILNASYNLDTPLLFSAIIATSISGLLFFGVIVLIEKVISRRFNFKIVK